MPGKRRPGDREGVTMDLIGAYVSMTITGGDDAGTYYYNQDERSSVRNLTDATGAVVNTYDYTAFGEAYGPSTDETVPQRYQYTGRELNDVAGNHYFRYRSYSAGIGAFASRDPLGYVDGAGLYNGYFATGMGIDPYGNYTLQDSYASLVKKKVKPANGTTTIYVTVSNVPLTTYHYSDQQLFDEWHALEKARRGWWKNLPKCPCKLSKKRRVNYRCVKTKDGVIIEESWETEHSKSGEPFNPDSKKWDDPKVPSGAEAALHPGAAYSMRSKGVKGRYNQCIYDKNLKLITTAPGAGTVDYYKEIGRAHV